MTPRQRVLTAIAHQQPDRVPIALDFAPEVQQRLQQHFGLEAETFGRWTGNDLVPVVPAFPGRASDLRYADPTIELTDD